MSVILFLTSGDQRTVETGDSARLDGAFFIVMRQDRTTGRVDTILTLRNSDVVGAEIVLDGVKVDYVPGAAQRSTDR